VVVHQHAFGEFQFQAFCIDFMALQAAVAMLLAAWEVNWRARNIHGDFSGAIPSFFPRRFVCCRLLEHPFADADDQALSSAIE